MAILHTESCSDCTLALPPAATVLFVDDDAQMASSIERSFRKYRVDLRVALHGMQGITQAVELQPQAIITDLQMPFASGEELIDCLSRNPATSGVPIIVITGRADAELTPQLSAKGVVALLNKPFAFDDLIGHLAEIIPIELESQSG